MSQILSVPASIINKQPTADLWDGQTDENEMGITYKDLDLILYYYIDQKMKYDDIVNIGIAKEKLDLVISKINNSEFKRKMPVAIENIWE